MAGPKRSTRLPERAHSGASRVNDSILGWASARECHPDAGSVDLDDPDLAADEARALGLTAGDDLELVVGRAGNAKAPIAVAFAGGVDLGLYTVGATIGEEHSTGPARRGHESGRSAAVLGD